VKAVVLVDGARHELQDVPTPQPGRDEIRIRVEASGVCGTDLSIMHGHFPPGRGRPLVLGHEFAGTVDALGDGVSGFAVGDRVAADPNLYCGDCEWCSKGAYNLCEQWAALGITRPGALAEYVVVPARLAVRVPGSLSASAGALIEPLSCAIHAFQYADVKRDATTVIFGGGMMGLTCLALANQLGHQVTVVEIHEARRRLALEMGAATVVESAAELTGRFDYVMEATGVPAVVQEAFKWVRTRGTYLQLSLPPDDTELTIRPLDINQRELRIVGSFSLADAYPDAADMIESVAPALERLVTHRFRLDQFDEALAAMARPDALKIHLEPHLPLSRTEGEQP
jgi:2-desacetyl-2-hydroxyethyl bacteriochlorophyllide A dehydrogenase